MSKPRPEVQHVAITFRNGTIGLMQWITKQPARPSRPGWERKCTKEAVERSIAKASETWSDEQKPIQGWRLIDADEAAAIRAARG